MQLSGERIPVGIFWDLAVLYTVISQFIVSVSSCKGNSTQVAKNGPSESSFLACEMEVFRLLLWPLHPYRVCYGPKHWKEMQTSIKYLLLVETRTLCFHENSLITICNITKKNAYVYTYLLWSVNSGRVLEFWWLTFPRLNCLPWSVHAHVWGPGDQWWDLETLEWQVTLHWLYFWYF